MNLYNTIKYKKVLKIDIWVTTYLPLSVNVVLERPLEGLENNISILVRSDKQPNFSIN